MNASKEEIALSIYLKTIIAHKYNPTALFSFLLLPFLCTLHFLLHKHYSNKQTAILLSFAASTHARPWTTQKKARLRKPEPSAHQ